ncbi:MAG TPA: hypothetical protein VLS48_09155 [Anaerolineales bacterium]|nr:hypothetical protein [Anaerolineales bacterium]
MAAQAARFDRLLLLIMAALYLISLGAFTYANWRVEADHNPWFYAVNALIISLPLVLFYGSTYVLITAWRAHSRTEQIAPRLARIIHWAPRLAATGIIFFITLFSFDVFEMEASLLERLGAFIIHSLPSIFLILVLVLAWRRPVVGFGAFLLAGLFFLRFVFSDFGLAHFLLFSGPLLLISGLFYADWRWLKPAGPLDAVL